MSLKKLRKEMTKSLKDDYIILEGEDGTIDDVQIFIPTGCTALDYIMTNRRGGGVPVGKIVEITGIPHSGKSLLATTLCANAQKMGGLCIYLDPENAFNDDFAKQIGLDIDAETFWYPKPPPPTVEALFSFLFDLGHQIDSLKKSNEWPFEFVLVIWDSVAATPCKQDLETENPHYFKKSNNVPRHGRKERYWFGLSKSASDKYQSPTIPRSLDCSRRKCNSILCQHPSSHRSNWQTEGQKG
jgi:RecA/RadA recombinase